MNKDLHSLNNDDFVECFIFTNNLLPSFEQVTSFVENRAKSYIWHQQHFKLKPVDRKNENDLPSHLYGITHFGENIEDEWFIVFLLMGISELIPDAVIRVVDSDGEFLLIEAADILPKWMDPDRCNQRVYIHNGFVRIIPLRIFDENVSVPINEAIKYIRDTSVSSEERIITDCIRKRLNDYPEKIRSLQHRFIAYLPAKVAALLDANPTLIADAVNALAERDLVDKRQARKARYFPPLGCVRRSVLCTRFLYAMLTRQRVEGREGWRLPPPSHPAFKEQCLGYKITCGFEILASRQPNNMNPNIELTKKWKHYVDVLKRKGYFKNLLEGSVEYKERENNARNFFVENYVPKAETESTSFSIFDLLETIKFDVKKYKEEESNLPEPDDESWMEVTEEELTKTLEERFGVKQIDTSTPESFSNAMKSFLNQASGIEGVEFPKSENKNKTDSMVVDFKAETFCSTVQNMIGFMKVEDTDASSEESDLSQAENDEEEDENVNEDGHMKKYMDMMDKELEKSTLSESFVKKSSCNDSSTCQPVDVDMNALENILRSYEEQCGGTGPAGNLVHSMGMQLKSKRN